jgi:hypothetical protein
MIPGGFSHLPLESPLKIRYTVINWFLFIETELRRKKNGTDYC